MLQKILAKKNRIWSILSYAFVIISLVGLIPMKAYAAPSWIRAGESDVYGDSGIYQEDAEGPDEQEQDSIIKHANKFIMYTDGELKNLKEGNSLGDISMDSIVFGRLAGKDISIGKFELYDGNPYGIIGAYGYRLIRNVIYGILLIYFMVLLVDQLVVGGAKKRAELKETLYNLLFIFGMLQFMPVFVNTFTVLRDELIVLLADEWGMSNFSGLNRAIASVLQSDDRTIATSMLSIGWGIAPFFYMGSYVSNSLLATGFFIIFPFVLLRSMKNKALFTAWCGNFFSYLIFPFFDFIFLSIPLAMENLLRDTGFTGTFAYMVMCVLFVWAVIPTRNGLMRFLGNSIGASPSNGFGALAGMAMMAMRGAGAGSRGGSGGGERGGFFADMANSNKYEALSANMGNSIAEATASSNSIGGIGSLLKDKDGMPLLREDESGLIKELTTEDVMGKEYVERLNSSSAGEDADGITTVGGVEDAAADSDISAMNMATDESVEALDDVLLEEGNGAENSTQDGVAALDGRELEEVVSGDDLNALKEPTTNEYGELVMPDSDNQREVLENRRLENLDRMEKAQQAADYQQSVIDEYDKQIADIRVAGADDKKVVDDLAKENAARGADISRYQQQITADEQELKKYTPGSQDYKDTKQRIDTNNATLRQLQADNDAGERRQESLTADYNKKYGDVIAKLETQKAQAVGIRDNAKAMVAQRQTKEQDFANIEKLYGGKGEVYTSKSQYSDAVRNREIEKRSMTYRNFDSGANLSLLSPQEKADFYRQRAYLNAAKTAVNTGAGLATGFIGASAMIYGGPQATAMGAAGGYMAGKGLTSKAVSVGEDAGAAADAVSYKTEVKEYNELRPEQRGERFFTSGGTKKVATKAQKVSSASEKSSSKQKTVAENVGSSAFEMMRKDNRI